MDIEHLKTIWVDLEETLVKVPGEENIANLLTRSSKSIIAKMKRNVMTELLLVILLFGCVAVYYFFAFHGWFREITWAYSILLLVFAGYFYRKYALLRGMDCAGFPVKNNLQQQLITLEKYVHFYLLGGTALVPLTIIFLAFVFYKKMPTASSKLFFFPVQGYFPPLLILLWIAAIAVIFALAWRCNRWWAYRLYGRHIRGLKELLSQLQEDHLA
ncbi:MAG TPA: hypothetical protein VFS36_13635 [Chitinophagaceae bacterium]|jgi:hypothetical protein|nr:hypothetical protein [Chitinophagaceae bacterium]